MIVSAEVVLFAIQGALKLYAGARQAYVEATLDRPLILPLPRVEDLSDNADAVIAYFTTTESGQADVAKSELLQALLLKPEENVDELKTIYHHLIIQDLDYDKVTGRLEISAAEVTQLLTIRQFSKAEAAGHPGSFQRLAGTIVEIAVDYFAAMPGAVSESRPEGRVLLAFLKGISDVEFATAAPKELIRGVLVGVLDAASGTPSLLVTGEKEQLLITGMAKSLAEAINRPDLNTEKKKRNAADWAQVVASAVAKGATDTVLANPSLFLGKTDAGKIVLHDVIAQIADLAFGSDRIEVQKVLSTEGVTTIAQAALGAVSRNPEILGSNNTGLKKLVSEVAKTLATSKLKGGKDLAPQVIALILDRSTANLDLLWDNRDDPGENLLFAAAQQALVAIAAAAAEAPDKRTPTFAQNQLLSILDAVFAEVQENPAWVVDQITGGRNNTVEAALTAALAAMKGRKLSQFGAEAAQDVLRASVLAVGARIEFLDKLPPGDAAAGKAFLTAVLDAVLAAALKTPASDPKTWRLARKDVIQSLVEASFSVLARKGVTTENLKGLRLVLDDLSAGKILPDDFADALKSKLAT